MGGSYELAEEQLSGPRGVRELANFLHEGKVCLQSSQAEGPACASRESSLTEIGWLTSRIFRGGMTRLWITCLRYDPSGAPGICHLGPPWHTCMRVWRQTLSLVQDREAELIAIQLAGGQQRWHHSGLDQLYLPPPSSITSFQTVASSYQFQKPMPCNNVSIHAYMHTRHQMSVLLPKVWPACCQIRMAQSVSINYRGRNQRVICPVAKPLWALQQGMRLDLSRSVDASTAIRSRIH